MDLILRRRAVYTGMRPYFDDHELFKAITLWQTDYSEKPRFALSVFVARCCNRPELKAQRAKILASIFNAMDLPEAQLLPDAINDTRYLPAGEALSATLSPSTEHELDHKTTIFAKLMAQMLLKFNEEDDLNIRKFLAAHLNQIKTDERRIMHLREWLGGHTEMLGANYNVEILQKMINLSYVAMCEYVGPVKADEYLSQAIRETEPLSLELGFKLHDLL